MYVLHLVTYSTTDRGQGLNNAFQDSFQLIEALKAVAKGEKSLEIAIKSYEEEMMPRGRQEVQISLQQAMMAHDWNKLTQSPIFKIGANKLAAAAEKT